MSVTNIWYTTDESHQIAAALRNGNMTNHEEEVIDELKKMTRLLSIIATHGLSQRDQIAALARAGFTPKQTGELLGTTSNTVSVYLSAIRKAAKRAKS